MPITDSVGNRAYTRYPVLPTRADGGRRLERAVRVSNMRAVRRSRISSEGEEALPPAASHLLERRSPPRRPESPALYAYLLDLDDELAEELEVRMRLSARQHATVRLLDADTGACELGPWVEAWG